MPDTLDIAASFRSIVLFNDTRFKKGKGERGINPFLGKLVRLESIILFLSKHISRLQVEFSGKDPFSDLDGVVKVSRMIKQHNACSVLHSNSISFLRQNYSTAILDSLRKNEVLAIFLTLSAKNIRQFAVHDFKSTIAQFYKKNFKVYFRYKAMPNETLDDSKTLKQFMDSLSNVLNFEIAFERVDVYKKPQITDNTMPMKGIPEQLPCGVRFHLVLSSSGDIYPCMVGMYTPQLLLGNWHTEDVDDLLKRLVHNNLFNDLYKNGPLAIVRHKKLQVENLLQRPYLDGCHACRLILETLAKKSLFL